MNPTAKGVVQYALEVTPGTLLPAKHMLPVDGTPSMQLSPKWDTPDEQRGSLARNFENMQELYREASIDLEGEYYPTTCLGLWTLVANPAPTVTGTGPYVFTMAAADALGTASFEEFDGTNSWTYSWAFCETFELTYAAQAALKYKFTGKAQNKTAMGVNPGNHITTLTQPSDLPLVGQNGNVAIDAVGGTPGTTVFGELLTAKITFDTGLVPMWTAGGLNLYTRTWRKKRLVKLDLEIDFPAAATAPGTIAPLTEFNDFVAGTYRLFSLNLTQPVTNLGLQIIVPCKYTVWDTQRGKESVTAKISAESVFDGTQSYDFKVIATGASALATY